MPRSMARSRARAYSPESSRGTWEGARLNGRRVGGACPGMTTRRDSGDSACISLWNSWMPVSMRLGCRLRHTRTAVPNALRREGEQQEEDAAHLAVTCGTSHRALCATRDVFDVLARRVPIPSHRTMSRASRSAPTTSTCRCRTEPPGTHRRGGAPTRPRRPTTRRCRCGPSGGAQQAGQSTATAGELRPRWPRDGARPALRRPRTPAPGHRVDPRRGCERCPRTPRPPRSQAARPSRPPTPVGNG